MKKSGHTRLAGYDYLQRILSKRLNEEALTEAQNNLEIDIEIVDYQELNRSASVHTRLEDWEGAARIHMLEAELTTMLRRPWRPLLNVVKRKLALAGVALTKRRSPQKAHRLQRSADKRHPDRFLSSTTKLPPRTSKKYRRQSRKVSTVFGDPSLALKPLHMQVGSGDFMQERLKSVTPSKVPTTAAEISFSIITPYYAHLDYFKSCALSVLAAAEQSAHPVEWIIFNDDPSTSDEALRAHIPDKLLTFTKILSDGQNHGIVTAQNRAIAATLHNWIVLLDCDDELEAQALKTLGHEIVSAPQYRYFTSLMTDIDAKGKRLRSRKREHTLTDLFDKGMIAGHMVAFRKDLFEELGGFNAQFSGVQDFDFALRVALREPLKGIDKQLYRYRWHGESQSVGKTSRQDMRADAVRAQILRTLPGAARLEAVNKTPLRENPTALCIIRTQGARMELLAETIASVHSQAITMAPCVIVHGDQQKFDFVNRQLSRLQERTQIDEIIVLHAGEHDRRRGYPCNVGLGYLRDNAAQYDLLCFLDDDDYFLPNFGERMVKRMRAQNADLVYGIANAVPTVGEPVVQHGLRPAFGLLGGNFITSNSFIMRSEAVLDADLKFDETMDYMEDYDFLLQALQAGFYMTPLMEAVCEYRLIGDGNTEIKRDQRHFKECQLKIQARAEAIAAETPIELFWAELASFPGTQRASFKEEEIMHMKLAEGLIRKTRK